MGAVAHIGDYKKGVYFQNETRGDMSWNGYETNVLLRNLGKDEHGLPTFVDVAMALGADDLADSRGIAMLDFDNDGDLDVAVSHNPGDLYKGEGVAPALYRNDVGHKRNWLAVELVGKTVNRDAVGATVAIEAGGAKQMRLLSAGSSYASQHSDRLYFGLADTTLVSRLTVTWPGGAQEHFDNIEGNRLIRIVQGESIETVQLPALTGQNTVPDITDDSGGK